MESGGAYTVLNLPGWQNTAGFVISASGAVAGDGYNGAFGDGVHQAFVESGGTYTVLNVPGAVESDAQGINAAGEVAGQFTTAAGKVEGFIWSGGSYTIIDPPNSTATFVRNIKLPAPSRAISNPPSPARSPVSSRRQAGTQFWAREFFLR
jgi:probable HAF family extracellular repeat protein